jgi:hypothetical protein
MTRRALLGAAAALTALTLAVAAGPPAAQAGGPAYERLKGRWVRLDGGYVIEVRSVDNRGVVDAAYFNPQPINVGRAQATRDGSALRLVVELRAPNYPGSTYTLSYDPTVDQLRGVYFQAVAQQRFDVIFVRRK